MTCGRNGFLVVAWELADVSPVTTSCPACKLSAVTAVFAPSEVPAFTSNGRTNSPSFNQMISWRSLEPLSLEALSLEPLFGFDDLASPAASLADGSTWFCARTSGEICASEDGDQRNAALGTSNALDSFRVTKCTLAVR